MSADAGPEPHAYYTRTIPEQFNRMLEEQSRAGEAGQRVYAEMRAVNASIQVEVRGATPGRFFLNIEAGRMAAGDAPSVEPFLSVTLELASFRRLAREAGESLTALLGALAGLGGDMKLTRKRVRDLEAVAGLIRFEVTGEAGFTLLTRFGAPAPRDEPDAVIRMSESSYRDLRSGRLDPQIAFLEDAIHAEGDMQKVMQLAFATVAPD
jgi:hypothetical protein